MTTAWLIAAFLSLGIASIAAAAFVDLRRRKHRYRAISMFHAPDSLNGGCLFCEMKYPVISTTDSVYHLTPSGVRVQCALARREKCQP